MPALHRRFYSGFALTAFVAILAIALSRLPGLAHLGALSLALLLGLAGRAFWRVPEGFYGGIDFAARKLLRLGIILLGLRLDFELLRHAGFKVLALDATVIFSGLLGISWLGRRLGLDPVLACLIAVDSSICGGSAVAAAAPTLRAKEADVAMVIPLGSLIGTAAMLVFTVAQHQWALAPDTYGLMAGSTLHEVAQVMAAVAPFPESADMGTVTKLTRVILLVPAVWVLGWVADRRQVRESAGATHGRLLPSVPKPWFVLGFLGVGAVNTLAVHFFPDQRAPVEAINHHGLGVANFFMAMAMAGMGLQVDFARLRANGLPALGTALFGWLGLATLAAGGIWLMIS